MVDSIKIKRTVNEHGQSLLKPNELCSTYVLNFLSLFQISSFDSFGDMSESHKNRFMEKILEIFTVWIDFTLARFNQYAHSLQHGIASFYVEYNGIFENIL